MSSNEYARWLELQKEQNAKPEPLVDADTVIEHTAEPAPRDADRPTEQTVESELHDEAMKMVLERLQTNPLKIIAGLAQVQKHAGAQMVLSIPSDEHPRKRAYAEFAKWWFNLDEASTPYHISCAVEQFMDALMNKEQPHIHNLLGAVRSAYKSAEAKPITGANKYHSDLSPLDKRYIRRKRR